LLPFLGNIGVAFRCNGLNEDSLQRLVGQRLGARRLSQPIRRELVTAIHTALRRSIIARNSTGYYGATPTIHHYDDAELIKVLRSVIRKGYEYEREHLTNQRTCEAQGGKNQGLAGKNRSKDYGRDIRRNTGDLCNFG
jgi:hypothetical protein